MSEESKLRQIVERTKRYQKRSNSCSDETLDVRETEQLAEAPGKGLKRERKLLPKLKLFLPEGPFKSKSKSSSHKRHSQSLERKSPEFSEPKTPSNYQEISNEEGRSSPLCQEVNRLITELFDSDRRNIKITEIQTESSQDIQSEQAAITEIQAPVINIPTVMTDSASTSQGAKPKSSQGNQPGDTEGHGNNDTNLNTTLGRQNRSIIDLRSIPYFDGTGNVSRFVTIASSVMNHQTEEEDQILWLDALKTKLDGAAYEIGKDAMSWKELKLDLLDRFLPVQTVEEVESKISGIRFHRNIETIEEYLDRIIKLGNAYAEVLKRSHDVTADAARSLADHKMIRHFIDGLDDPIRTILIGMDIKTVKDASFKIRRLVHLEEAHKNREIVRGRVVSFQSLEDKSVGYNQNNNYSNDNNNQNNNNTCDNVNNSQNLNFRNDNVDRRYKPQNNNWRGNRSENYNNRNNSRDYTRGPDNYKNNYGKRYNNYNDSRDRDSRPQFNNYRDKDNQRNRNNNDNYGRDSRNSNNNTRSFERSNQYSGPRNNQRRNDMDDLTNSMEKLNMAGSERAGLPPAMRNVSSKN